MVNSHIGHNSHLGDHIILANGALLGGHVTVGDRAFISGNCCVHQFCRVGTLALMQGNCAISQDLAPFTMVHHVNELCGLNIIGLRRAGIGAAERLELKQLYKKLFRSGENFRSAISAAQKEFTSAPAKTLLEFCATTKRGVCADSGSVSDVETSAD
jgi:UDP-N-acetylglucosamine acyltransferase